MYATTREFLERFGLNDLGDLPKVEEMSDALGFELPRALLEPVETTSALPFESPAGSRRPNRPKERSSSTPSLVAGRATTQFTD